MKTKSIPQPSSKRSAILMSITAMSVPVGVVVASLIFPLRPFIQQALMGITLIWIYASFISIFQGLS